MNFFYLGRNNSLGIQNSLFNSCDLVSHFKNYSLCSYVFFFKSNTGNDREELEIFYYYNVLVLPMKQYSVI